MGVLATTVVPTVPTVPTVLATVVPTPAMATATHTRVPMLVMLVPMVPAMVVPTLVMAMATHTPPPPPLATMDAATATHTTIRLSSDVAHEGCSRCASLELGTRMGVEKLISRENSECGKCRSSCTACVGADNQGE